MSDASSSLNDVAAMAARAPYRNAAKAPRAPYNTGAPRTGGRVVGEYVYGSEFQIGSYKVVKHEPKGFHQERWDDDLKKYLKGRPEDNWVCWYRQAEFLDRPEGAPIYVVEGEKDAETLRGHGLAATTLAGGGSMKWLPHLARPLDGSRVVIFVDHDDPGERYALKIAYGLVSAVAEVKLVRFPELPAGGDVSDFLDSHPVAALLAKVEATPAWHVGAEGAEEWWTDLGNAKRLVERYGAEFRYVPSHGWLAWAGSHWEPDADDGAITRAAEATVRAMQADALARPTEDPSRKRALKHALDSESANSLAAMVRLARRELPILARADTLDQQPGLLTCPNGVVDLRTGRLREARRQDLVTRCARVDYIPGADCPVFTAMLKTIMPDEETRAWLQRAAGYSLTGTAQEEVIFFPFGSGANGKTKFLKDALWWVAGTYGAHTPFSSFLEQRNDRPSNDIAALAGARFVYAIESAEGKAFAGDRLKDLTGRDPVTARFLYHENFTFIPEFVPWVASNSKPKVRDTSPGFWRRMRVIPFAVEIPEEKQDRALPDKLHREAAGILAWIVAGAKQWYADGLGWCAEVKTATAEYREESDAIAPFLAQCCEFGSSEEFTVTAADLYRAYKTWAEGAGEYPVSSQAFGAYLTQRGIARDKNGLGGTVRRLGLRLPVRRTGDSGQVSDNSAGCARA